ncbi:MAG: SHOCT domain-containing protein [Bacteroidales bacterium]
MTYGHGFTIVWLIIIAVVVTLVIVLVVKLTKSNIRNCQNNEKETPVEILKRRYALGEISKEEFEDMKQDILKD